MAGDAPFKLVERPKQLAPLLEQMQSAAAIGFDTEFVSEDRYLPHLCLIQVAVDGQFWIIDPLAIEDLGEFWELMANGSHVTIAHAAREELRFFERYAGALPHDLFDIQLAAGFVGTEYPASYRSLVARYAGQSLDKAETRSNWRKRPLSSKQLAYAVEDVRYLRSIYEQLLAQLKKFERVDWFHDEMDIVKQRISDEPTAANWQRVSGWNKLRNSSLVILQELWQWRESLARDLDIPTRRVLRDDLMVDISKRRSGRLADIKSVRGMDRPPYSKHVPAIAEVAERALQIPEADWPQLPPRREGPNFSLLGQFCWVVLSTVCRRESISASLVGSTQDVRNLLLWKLCPRIKIQRPPLASGWRAEVVGDVMDGFLHGTVVLGVHDPLADEPLELRDLNE